MGKITVKHYLNTNLKPYEMDGEKLYKLYFLLRYNNKNTKIKSLVNVEMTEKEYNERILNDNDTLTIRIKNEIIFIEKVIQIAEKTKLAFDMKLFNDIWEIATYPIIEKFDSYIQWVSQRFNGFSDREIDFYDTQNIETFCNVLNGLKLFINNSKYSISDEMYLLQFFDKNVLNEYRKGLKKNEIKQTIYEQKSYDNSEKNIIKIEYEPKEYDNTYIVQDCLIKKDRWDNPFLFQTPRKEKTGNIEIDCKYFGNLINSVTKG